MKDFRFITTISAITLALSVSIMPVSAQQVVTDGMTSTNISVSGNTTNVSTTTVSGGNAFNSFTKLNVDSGKVVNLIVPGSASNLINIVKAQQSVINGALNGIKGGQIGGNIFIANPYGIVIGSSGSINVGQLTAITPTKDFANNFFTAAGVVNPGSLNTLLSGSAPMNSGASITNSGVINVVSNATLTAPNVINKGKILANASFKKLSDYSTIKITDVVNLNATDSLSIKGGSVNINADKFTNTGNINAFGGDVNITKLSSGTIIIKTTKSTGSTLDITPTELSKIKTDNLTLSADNVYFYNNTSLTSANSLMAYANNSVIVSNGVSLTTKNNLVLTGAKGVTLRDYAKLKSSAESITMNASNGSISVGKGVQITANSDINSSASSNITLNSSSKMTAGGSISIYAGNIASIYGGVNLTAKGDIDLIGVNRLNIYSPAIIKAGGDINIDTNIYYLQSGAKLIAGGKIYQ